MVKKISKIVFWILMTVMCLNTSVFAAGNSYEEAPTGTFCWPIAGRTTTNSPMYDRTGVVNGSDGYHCGWDFDEPQGTEIQAIGAGKVVASGSASGIGYYCVIKHTLASPLIVDLGNGQTVNYGTTIYSRYCHQCEMPLVKVGDTVAGGQVIGHVGNTGLSTGAHLHLDIMSTPSSVSKSLGNTEGFGVNGEKRGNDTYNILVSKGDPKKANFAPSMVCGVLEYVGQVDTEHEVDTSPDYGTGQSFGTGNAGSLGGTSSTARSYSNIGSVVVRGGKLLREQVLDPGTGITDKEDELKELEYTGAMTDYGTLKTFNTLAARLKVTIQKFSRIGAAILVFIGTVSVGLGLILQNRNAEQRTFLIEGLLAVGVGSLIVVIAVYIVNMVVEYM